MEGRAGGWAAGMRTGWGENMRFTQMDASRFVRAVCGIAAPVSRIARDAEISAAFSVYCNGFDGSDEMFIEHMRLLLGKVLPGLLDRHYEDTVKIVAGMTGKRTAQIRAQRAMQTLTDIRAFLDKDFIRFCGDVHRYGAWHVIRTVKRMRRQNIDHGRRG